VTIANELTLPLRLRIADIFSAIDRNYTLIWKKFYNFVCNQLWFARKMRYFLSTIKLCFIMIFKPNAQLLADHIAFLFKKSRKHWQIIKTFKEILTIMQWFTPAFKTIKIQIQGCINDSERTRSATIGQAFIITQTFLQRLDYGISQAATPFGALGIRIWIISKNG
jgi:ribosomal protein S3